MRAGVVGFGQELAQSPKGSTHCVSSQFLWATHFLTLLCWMNKNALTFLEGGVPNQPLVSGCGAGRCVLKELPVSHSLSFQNLPAPAPRGWQVELGWRGSRPGGLRVGSRQPSSLAGAPVSALLVPVSLSGRRWCARTVQHLFLPKRTFLTSGKMA